MNTRNGPEDQRCFPKYLCYSICVTDIIIKHHYSGKWVILSEIKAFAEGFCLLEEYQSAIMKSSLQTDTYTTESEKAIPNEIINVQSSSIRLQTRYCLFPWLDAAVREHIYVVLTREKCRLHVCIRHIYGCFCQTINLYV